ncbi:serine hydrolase domain-containing protein [Kordiimonas sp.]|uniref:serine hydrolase domain-containing protein n=1 Tax=Kordiimonas sp. TaxID=1970157 RepID=UPI003A8F75E6
MTRSAPLLRTITALMMGLGLTGPLAAQSQVPDVTDARVVEAFVDGLVKPTMAANHSPSGVVALMKGGDMIFAKGYGYQDVDNRIPMDAENSLVRPGSISKLFTWVAVMQLVEQGKLDLDADVNTYLNTFQVRDTWPGQPVTLRHIMTHTAGFEAGGLGYLIMDDASRIMPLAQSLERYQPARINPPGEHTGYSNWGSALAGLIVQNVSGMDYNDYIETHIFDVLGMNNATFREPLPKKFEPHMAKAYGYGAGKYHEQNYEIISNFGPAGSLAATAYDMSLFAQALLNGGSLDGNRILKPETMQQILNEGFTHDPRVRGIGLGFLKRRYGPDDLANFGHDGGTTIFLSHFGLSFKEDMMLFSSFSGPGARATHTAFVKAFYDEFFPRDILTIAPPEDFAARAGKYAGTYHSWRNNFTMAESITRALGGSPVIPMPDNTLLISGKRYAEVDKNLFRQVDDYGRIAFQEDADGDITGYVIDGTGVMQFYKAPFYETWSFIQTWVGLSLLLFVGIVLKLLYRFRDYRTAEGLAKTALRASVALAFANLLFVLFGYLGISAGEQALTYALPATLKFALVFPLLATVAAAYHAFTAYRVWQDAALGSVFARLRFSMVTLAGLFMVWFYAYWNLLGFNYHG